MQEFKDFLKEWFHTQSEAIPQVQQTSGRLPTGQTAGPVIAGVSALAVVEHVRAFAAIIDDVKKRGQVELVSGTPETLAELADELTEQVGGTVGER